MPGGYGRAVAGHIHGGRAAGTQPVHSPAADRGGMDDDATGLLFDSTAATAHRSAA
ncbi:hypothetical protein QOZ88_03585 [Blastococcus sp. BMG 814]|uniref:Uncharacterized protein n=1 Tax=Blastococcus carthaginiensis TaxID=3050034 RepID=A0ABT9I831_9ACTN|nr:hypothetical protein [Blastococcus carthaginiensis]MDP5181708.1 hypothetical protein [Blastococcus carthaginiensis]